MLASRKTLVLPSGRVLLGKDRGSLLDYSSDLRPALRHPGPLGRLPAHPTVAEKLEEHLVEHFRLVGLALVPALLRIEELDVGQRVLLEVGVLHRIENILLAEEVDRG